MFLNPFKKIKRVDEEVLLPSERFSFINKESQLQFQDEISHYFKDKPDFKLDFSQGVIHRGNGIDYGLDNVAQMYHQAGAIEKRNVVKDHFNRLFKGEEENRKILKNKTNYSFMKKYVAIRLYPLAYLKTTGKDNLIYKEDLEGVLTVLVLDLPSTVIILQPEDVAKWEISEEDLFTLGFKNTFANNSVDVTQEKFDDNATLWMIGSDTHLFAGAYIYNLPKYQKLIGKYGTLIAIPHRHMILAFPINDNAVISAINQLIIITDGLYKQGPGSISPNIFWYDNKKFINLPYKLDLKEKSIGFSPPEEFIEILNQVAEQEKKK